MLLWAGMGVMRRRTLIITAILAMAVACVVVASLAHREEGRADQIRPSVPQEIPTAGAGIPAGQTPDVPRLQKSIVLAQPDLQEGGSVERIMADTEPAAREVFDDGLKLMRGGSFSEAREAFQQIVDTSPDRKAKAAACWAIGLAYYLEGGAVNLHQAANQFIRFRDSYGSDEGVKPLVEAAMIDIPVVSIELMHCAPSQYERTSAASLAAKTLSAFLAAHPDSPQAPAARDALRSVAEFLAAQQ